ncbi:serine acetyltransferase [Escherichia coli]|nr:serine acetyltransferase [Escherichia coli]
MIKIVNEDLHAFTKNGSFASKVKCTIISHTFHLVLMIRLGQFLSKIPVIGAFFRLVIEYSIRIIFSSDISLRARIGGGLVIMHGHDIVIGRDVVIGRNCKILNGVTLDNKDTESTENQQPVVGDNVIIGTGAKILGKVVIGNNVKIGANSVVISDIAPDSVAVGIPARVTKGI